MRLAYLVVYRATDPLYGHLLHDAKLYHEWAAALARGESGEAGVFYQAPLYPALLAFLYRLFGPEPLAGYLFQMAAGLGTIALVHRIGARAYGTRAGVAAAALASLYGVYPFYETKLLPGALAVLLACLVLERFQAADGAAGDGPWLPAGLVLGLAGLARPDLLLLVPLALAWIARDGSRPWRRRARRGALCLLGTALAISPVAVRNYRVAGDPVLISANGGITFYQGNNPAALGTFSVPEGMSGSIFKQRDESRRLAEEATGRALRDSEVSRFWWRRGLAFILEDPLRYLRLEARKSVLALDSYEHALEYNPHLDPSPVRYLTPLPFALVLGLAAGRVFASRRLARPETPLLLLLAANAATILLFFAASRYRLPATGPLLAIAGCGAVTILERLRDGSRAVWGPLLLAAAVAALSLAPVAGRGAYRAEDAMGLSDRAEAYVHAGKLEEAAATYREAIERNPLYPFAHLDLAKVLRQLGDREGAERSVRTALGLAPRSAEARFDLGVLCFETGRFGQAAEAFEEAFRLDPSRADAANNLLGTCLRLERYGRAVEVWREMKERGLRVDPPLEAWMQKNARRLSPLAGLSPGLPPVKRASRSTSPRVSRSWVDVFLFKTYISGKRYRKYRRPP